MNYKTTGEIVAKIIAPLTKLNTTVTGEVSVKNDMLGEASCGFLDSQACQHKYGPVTS
jgi:hypothetical protein